MTVNVPEPTVAELMPFLTQIGLYEVAVAREKFKVDQLTRQLEVAVQPYATGPEDNPLLDGEVTVNGDA